MPTGRPGRTVSSGLSIRLEPDTYDVMRQLGDRTGTSISGSLRAIANLWLSQWRTDEPVYGDDQEELLGYWLDLDAAAAAVTDWLLLQEREDRARQEEDDEQDEDVDDDDEKGAARRGGGGAGRGRAGGRRRP